MIDYSNAKTEALKLELVAKNKLIEFAHLRIRELEDSKIPLEKELLKRGEKI